MHTVRCSYLGLTLALTLLSVTSAEAQLPFRWFGPKGNEKDKNVPNRPAPVTSFDPRRGIEVNVEVAWLADPVTFPYYLEAHVTGSQVEVRGYVPNKTVREHALRIAQVYSSMRVIDSMKEHPSLLVRPTAMSSQQLQAAVLTSLRVALPKQHQQLKIDCKPDGTVFVTGPMSTYDEKVAVSHSLRRLHGCTSVQNLTSVPDEIALRPKTPITQVPITQVQNEPPVIDRKGPILIPSNTTKPPEVLKVDLPAVEPILDPRVLENRIKAACPQVTSVEVDMLTKTEVRINVAVRADKDVSPTAERILTMQELQFHRNPTLLFRVGVP